MKFTATVIAALGVFLMIFAGVQATVLLHSTGAPMMSVMFPLVFGMLAMALAFLMWRFGGPGYFHEGPPMEHDLSPFQIPTHDGERP